MKTYRVTKPFTLSDHRGTRHYGPGKAEEVTDAELGAYLPDVAHCLTETAAPKPPKSAPIAEPKETA